MLMRMSVAAGNAVPMPMLMPAAFGSFFFVGAMVMAAAAMGVIVLVAVIVFVGMVHGGGWEWGSIFEDRAHREAGEVCGQEKTDAEPEDDFGF